MASDVIHQLIRTPSKITFGLEMKTRCGVVACVETSGSYVAQMINENGGRFLGTYYINAVTCRKCINLNTTGNIHGKPPRSPSSPGRRPLDTDRATHATRRRHNRLDRATAARAVRGA